MAQFKPARHVIFMLFALIPTLAFAERPLEEASYSEGMKAITEMHVLNSLGLAGELIAIYKGLDQASYAVAILHNRKWRPGDDDLAWVDYHNSGKEHDPFAGLRPKDRHNVKKRLGFIQYLNGLIESGELNSVDEKKDALLGIEEQIKALKRTLAGYPDHYERIFSNKETPNTSLPPKTIKIIDKNSKGIYPVSGTLHGSTYNVEQPNGTYSKFVIKRFDKGGVHISRTDIRGATAGITGEYSGKLTGKNSAGGTAIWTWKKWKKPLYGTWEARW